MSLLKAEWIKLTKRWVFPVMTVILLVLTGMSAVVLLVLPEVAPDAIEGLPILTRRDASILGVQTVIGQTWFPLILAVVMLGSEVTSTAWAAALTRESRRVRHIAVRLGVLAVASWVAAVVAIALWEVLASIYTEGAGPFDAVGWFGVAWKVLLVQTTWVALGLGAIALLRSTGVAIGIVVAYSFLEGLLALWRPYGEVALSSASNALIGQVFADVSGGFGVGASDAMAFGQAVVVVIGWTALGAALTWLGLARREA
jgi:hypothetical protein